MANAGDAPASSKSPLSGRNGFKRARRRWSPAWRRRHRSRLRRERVWARAAEPKRHGKGRPLRRRVRVPVVLAALGLALVVVAALGYRDLRAVRSDLATARQTLQGAINDPGALRTPAGRVAVRAQVDTAVASLATARRRARDSVPLTLTKVAPGLRTQRSGLLALVDDATVASAAGRDLLGQIDALAERSQLRDGLVPVDGIRELARDVALAADRFRPLVRSTGGLWGPVGDARRQFNEVASSSVARLDQGSDAVEAATSFVGAEGDRRYLVAVQNNAEMRDQGMVLQYVVVRFTGRRLVFEESGSVGEIPLTAPAPTPIPPGTEEVFGSIRPTRLWQSVNATADFPWSGQAMADMYLQATGEPVDGVIAVDVPALIALLRVVGPVTTPGQLGAIDPNNAAQILLHDQYEGLLPQGDSTERRDRLGEVTDGVIDKLTSGGYDAVALGKELGDAALGGHVRLWSRFPVEQDVFVRTGLGAGPASADPDRTFHVAVENRTATKLDYYVKPSVRQEVELTRQGTAVVRTTVVVDNQAPVGAPPSFALGPDGVSQSGPGDYVAWLLLWGPAGSMQAGAVEESGLQLSQHVVDILPGQRRELTYQTVIPRAVKDGRLNLRLVPQSRFEPVDLQVEVKAPGWDIDGPPTWKGPWDRTLNLSWGVSR